MSEILLVSRPLIPCPKRATEVGRARDTKDHYHTCCSWTIFGDTHVQRHACRLSLSRFVALSAFPQPVQPALSLCPRVPTTACPTGPFAFCQFPQPLQLAPSHCQPVPTSCPIGPFALSTNPHSLSNWPLPPFSQPSLLAPSACTPFLITCPTGPSACPPILSLSSMSLSAYPHSSNPVQLALSLCSPLLISLSNWPFGMSPVQSLTYWPHQDEPC